MRRIASPLLLSCGFLALGSCAQIEAIPAPWEPGERQISEPQPAAVAAVPPWGRIGFSVRGKPIEAVNVGRGAYRVYIIGGLHGDCPEGPAVAEKLPQALVPLLLSEAGTHCTFRIVADGNPDGTALKSKGNTRGIDLNRNFPAKDFKADPRNSGTRALSELESTALLDDLKAFKPDLVVFFTTAAAGRGPQVSIDGAGPGPAYEFASAARQTDPRWRVELDRRHRAPGSIQSLVGVDMKKPILTVEYRRGEETQTNLDATKAALIDTASAGAAAKPKAAGTKAPAPKAKAPAKPVAPTAKAQSQTRGG